MKKEEIKAELQRLNDNLITLNENMNKIVEILGLPLEENEPESNAEGLTPPKQEKKGGKIEIPAYFG